MTAREIEVVVAAGVRAPAEAVWSVLCDLRRVPEWVEKRRSR